MRHKLAARALVALALIVYSLSSAVPLAIAQANVQGQWTTLPTAMPINPVHVALLYTGKVLVVSGSGNVYGNTNYQAGIWDPSTDTVTTQAVSWDMFCNGRKPRPFTPGMRSGPSAVLARRPLPRRTRMDENPDGRAG